MATSMFHEEIVSFTDMVAEFEDQFPYSNLVTRLDELTDEQMVHTRDTIWVDTPMIGSSYDGFDQTSNFDGLTELVVPANVGFHKSSPKVLSSKNLRNERAMRKWMNAAKMKLGSDVNSALRNRIALEGSIFTKRTVAPTGADDLMLAAARMTEKGVPQNDRVAMIGVRAAIGMVSNLAGRSTMAPLGTKAYETGMLNPAIAGFEVWQDDQPIRLAAAGGGTTTVNGANQFWEPAAFTTQTDGSQVNRDNRYSDLIITATTYANVKAGDAFTIAGVNSVHMISKNDTGQLQTFRVISKPAANTIRVAPAIISNGGSTIAGKEYQNVSATPANGAAITWLNTAIAELNPFFTKGSVLLLPGSFKVEQGDGWAVARATTPKLGLPITYVRQGDINTLNLKARVDIDFGTALLAPEQAGAMMFNQT